ncbi:MAG: ABC transporter ATP-binding protein [Hyphomicrobiales bacterium]|nr:ABC transporter ATP-binding protein [Hyphomicrobiales bacterium]MBV9050782.1 ABC transporter ATP-binding protein [Hyphomicrobiales bacterium]MBV9591559.1 ABC transporter ATP-binding protein [Hyphomicrobiales bacterium]MBV9975226.1 ABC transporter ATP-binding protein [Hyphomicrobiales bacterium]
MADNGTLTIDELNLALRLMRRLLLRVFAIGTLGIVAAIAFAWAVRQITPSGFHFVGFSSDDLGMVVVFVLVFAEIFWDGRKVGRALRDPMMARMPVLLMMSMGTTVAQKAAELGMKPGPFFGPLRPISKRR